MTESTKVRLVRCPKCENLLPELADYSVYQCGGCGAVLRAKDKIREVDALPEEPHEGRVAEIPTKSQDSSEKGIVDLSDASDTDIKSNSGSPRRDQKGPEKNDIRFAERVRTLSKGKRDKWVVEDDLDVNFNRDKMDNKIWRDDRDLNSRNGYAGGSPGSRQMLGWQAGETGEMEGFTRTVRTEVEGVRLLTSKYPDEGPSNYHSDSAYGNKGPLRSQKDPDGIDRVQYLQQDRAELLRKLDELREQLSRSCEVVDKPKEKIPLGGRMVPPEPYGVSNTWLPNGSSGSERASMSLFGPDKHVAGPHFLHNRPDSFPYSNGHEMPMHGFYPSMHNSNKIPGYGDTFGSQMHRKAPDEFPGQYHQLRSHPHYSGLYIDASHDLFEPHPRNATFHQPSCSCFHCYEKYRQVSAPMPPTTFSNKKFPDVPNYPMSYHPENRGPFAPHVHNARNSGPPPLNFHGPRAHTKWPSDLNSEIGGFVHCHPRRVVLAGGGRHCQPVAGGAPFLTCYNCFELLQLPKKVIMAKNQQRLQCGSCSTVINFTVVNKKLVLLVDAETKKTEVDSSYNEMVKEGTSHSHGSAKRFSANFSSDDYDNSGYDFEALDREPAPLSNGQYLNSGKPQEMQSILSSSSGISEDENSPDTLVAERTVANAVQQPNRLARSPPLPGSPLQEHFSYSANNHIVNRLGKGNQSSRSDHEKVVLNKVTTRQNSLKETSMATEMEVPFNEYSNSGISQDLVDASRESNQSRSDKGGESFFASIIKKSFKDFSKSSQPEEPGKSIVSVNGHAISDRLIKKAAKLAGPIQPGQYWYDFRAGFWGVIGGPCLGVIPPFIEEFNYSMPENCAGGNTGVFVNGRELHQKDLDLLVGRGLPTDRDRSYIIEISGRVLDEDTGEELESLGKLAPTVEKVKHGFGMKIPRAAAAQ
ncbi:DUF3133 domain-containing protein [Cephalotus follicularis]|uniref:DUF3133 domain-containing protein n=1 Tax=Cephalotus follicularis TaxID=3775 RepID=A0A1Q3AMP0_CEPFO|nr:DUF3133 domain-containing protein [Cephalotus follicularis]